MNTTIYDVIRRPRLTEKSARLQEQGNTVVFSVVFSVATDANKIQIREAVEKLFNVKVAKVATAHVLGKKKRGRLRAGRTQDWKKAYVTLAEGKIDFLENL